MSPNRIVVIDCETTGFARHDRIVEIAAVELDVNSGNVVDEFESLVNPMCAVGPTHVHGISQSMVEAAPTFGELVDTLAQRMHRATLVAHNLPFDVRFLRQELERAGVAFHPGNGYCTYRATKLTLSQACAHFGIPYETQHRALADARVTARLAATLHPRIPVLANASTSCRIGE